MHADVAASVDGFAAGLDQWEPPAEGAIEDFEELFASLPDLMLDIGDVLSEAAERIGRGTPLAIATGDLATMLAARIAGLADIAAEACETWQREHEYDRNRQFDPRTGERQLDVGDGAPASAPSGALPGPPAQKPVRVNEADDGWVYLSLTDRQGRVNCSGGLDGPAVAQFVRCLRIAAATAGQTYKPVTNSAATYDGDGLPTGYAAATGAADGTVDVELLDNDAWANLTPDQARALADELTPMGPLPCAGRNHYGDGFLDEPGAIVFVPADLGVYGPRRAEDRVHCAYCAERLRGTGRRSPRDQVRDRAQGTRAWRARHRPSFSGEPADLDEDRFRNGRRVQLTHPHARAARDTADGSRRVRVLGRFDLMPGVTDEDPTPTRRRRVRSATPRRRIRRTA